MPVHDEEMPAKTEGDHITTNTPGILQFGKDAHNIMMALKVSRLTNDDLKVTLSELLIEMKLMNKQLSLITGESFKPSEIQT